MLGQRRTRCADVVYLFYKPSVFTGHRLAHRVATPIYAYIFFFLSANIYIYKADYSRTLY